MMIQVDSVEGGCSAHKGRAERPTGVEGENCCDYQLEDRRESNGQICGQATLWKASPKRRGGMEQSSTGLIEKGRSGNKPAEHAVGLTTLFEGKTTESGASQEVQ